MEKCDIMKGASEGTDDNDFFKLIADVDNIAFDVSVSKESSISTMRSIKGATLPALLRRLTSLETTTQSQILTFLLNMKAIECRPHELMCFLTRRFNLTKKQVDAYAATVRCEIVHSTPLELESDTLEYGGGVRARFSSSGESPSASGVLSSEKEIVNNDESEHWLLQDSSVIGSQYYWHCTPEELMKHEGDRIAQEALKLLKKTSREEASSTDTASDETSILNSLSTLTSIQAGVFLFLETWLNLVPEDFMLCACTHSADPSPPDNKKENQYGARCTEKSPDVLDVLVDFLGSVSQKESLACFGLVHNGPPSDEERIKSLHVEVLPNSLLAQHFPCVSKLIVLMNDNYKSKDGNDEQVKTLTGMFEIDSDQARAESGHNESVQQANSSTMEESSANLLPPKPLTDSTSTSIHPYVERPLSLNPNDQGYYKHQLERVFSGQINDRQSLTSLRLSFFDTFGDDSLSEILEFESEIMSQSGGDDLRPESWRYKAPPASRFQNSSTAATASANVNEHNTVQLDDSELSTTTISKSNKLAESSSSSHSTLSASSESSSFDGVSFFKSLFSKSSKSTPEKEKQTSSKKEVDAVFLSHESSVSRNLPSSVAIPSDSHIIPLASKLMTSTSSDNQALLFVPQSLIPSALTAAAMGIRASTLAPRTSSSDTPFNMPYGSTPMSPENSTLADATYPSVAVEEMKNRVCQRRHVESIRTKVVTTLAKVNEDSFATCIEMYSYFGMMLSAVELRTAQDYVASSDLSMEIEVPARLFVDPIDRYIIKYNSTDALSSEKISYLVKSSREESELLPIENMREVTPPSVDRERTPISAKHIASDSSSRYVYDADFNNSSSAADQQNKRNQHRKEQRRRSMGSYLGRRVAEYSRKSSSRRQSLMSPESSRRTGGAKATSHTPLVGARGSRQGSVSIPSGGGDAMSSQSMSSRSSSFSMSEALFGSTQVYLGPSIFLDYQIYQVAANLTMRLHYMYCTIPMLEFVVDYVYPYDSKSNIRNRTPMLTRFRKESEKLQALFIGEVLVHPDVSTRAEVVIKMIKVAEHLAKIRSHHALMLVVYALHTHAIYRLKSTWAVVHAKLPGRWDVLTELVGMGGNKLVAFFCQRQPRNGISKDIREEMLLEMNDPALDSSKATSCEQNSNPLDDSSSFRKTSNDSTVEKNLRYSHFHFERLRLGEVPSAPRRRPHTYSSDSNSDLSYSESSTSALEEEQRGCCRDEDMGEKRISGNALNEESVLGKDNAKASAGGSVIQELEDGTSPSEKEFKDYENDDLEEDGDDVVPNILQKSCLEIPISMKIIEEKGNDDVTLDNTAINKMQFREKGRVRIGFKYMTSGQLCQPTTTAPDKIRSYESTSSLASFTGSSGKNHERDLETFSEESRSPVAKEQKPAGDRWRVENSTKVVRNNESESDDSASGDIEDESNDRVENVERAEKDVRSDDGLEVSTDTQISLQEESVPSPPTTDAVVETFSNVQSNQTVDILMSFTNNEKKPADSRRMSYRHLQVNNLSIRPPQSGLGEVKSDGLTSSNAFSGMPVASHKPFMPFLNGILQKIIRLNELPNFLRSQSANSNSAGQMNSNKETNDQGFLWVQSPGNSSSDPKLMMINFGKFRSISNLLMLIRSSQLTPFSLHVDFAVQAMLYRDAMYKSEDEIWERSSELE